MAGSDTKTAGAAKSAQPATPGLAKLEIKDIKVGKGKAADDGDLLYMSYTGKLKDGTVFDTNEKPDSKPFTFTLGQGMVIKGWDQGLKGMKVGGERELSIPSSLGYGDQGAGNGMIPPNSDLFFTVKMLDIVKKADATTVDKTDVKVGSGRAVKAGDTVTINYTGTLADGQKFDSSKDRNQPFTFKVGDNEVIPGMDYGIRGMKVGGIRKLHIPPMAGYGMRGYPPKIAPNSVLNFEIELLAIK